MWTSEGVSVDVFAKIRQWVTYSTVPAEQREDQQDLSRHHAHNETAVTLKWLEGLEDFRSRELG